MPLKCVLFDLDDTLIDWSGFSGDWYSFDRAHLRRIYDFVGDTIAPISVTFEAFTSIYRHQVTDAWSTGRANLRAPHLGHVLLATLEAAEVPSDDLDLDLLLDEYQWGPVEGTTLFPEVIEGLEMLRDRGLQLGLITNAFQPMRLRDNELRHFDILEYFPQVRISAADAGYLKPHPSIFEMALDQAGTQAHETIYIGDNPVADIRGAQSAGLKGILRVNAAEPPIESKLIVPDASINSLFDLIPVIDSLFPDQ